MKLKNVGIGLLVEAKRDMQCQCYTQQAITEGNVYRVDDIDNSAEPGVGSGQVRLTEDGNFRGWYDAKHLRKA